jgi:hypothetical protein
LWGTAAGVKPSLGDVEDHAASPEERRHGLEQLGAAPQHADSGRPEHLVSGERQEVGAEGVDVGGDVRDVLARVDARQGTGRVGGIGEHPHRGDGADHVRHGRERQELRPVEQAVEIGEVQAAVVGEGDPAQLEAALGGQLLPGDDVGVVLELVSTTASPGPRLASTPGTGHQVERLGGVLGEHDLVG